MPEAQSLSAADTTPLQRRIAELEDQLEEALDETRMVQKELQMVERLLEGERDKADKLLKRVLPESIAEELKRNDRVQARRHAMVSVMFMDIKQFTQIAENLLPEALVEGLDFVFKAFDEITRRHRLEKIKTIGDAYMVAGGIPEENKLHPVLSILAGLEIQQFMTKPHVQERLRSLARIDASQPEREWHLRLGIHTGGPIVASVIGDSKFAYDLWGDAVVTASRIESQGGPDEVNVSAATYELVKDLFACEPRGKFVVKNKDPMDMFFVHGLKPQYLGADGQPNDAFWQAAQAQVVRRV